MSDASQGPGWWQASDGKWYPPQPPSAPAAPGPTQITIPEREPIEWASLVGAALLIFGSFMTWATFGPFKVAGTDGDGWLTIAFGAGAAALSWRRSWMWAAVLAAFGGVIVAWKFVDLAGFADDDAFWEVSAGAGLYVCGLGALMAASTSIARWSQTRDQTNRESGAP